MDEKRVQEGKYNIRFNGGSAKPTGVRVGELAKVLVAFEAALSETVAGEDKAIKPQDVAVSLVEIRESSLVLSFEAPQWLLVGEAYEKILEAIRQRNFGELPLKAVEALRAIQDFAKNTGSRAEFSRGASVEAQAVLDPTLPIVVAGPLSGPTVLYGEVIRVGGKETSPHIWLRTTEYGGVSCSASKELVRQIARRLYQDVALEGWVEWDPRTNRVISFKVESVVPYEKPRSLEATFAELRELFGHEYEDVDDVVQYVASLREGEHE